MSQRFPVGIIMFIAMQGMVVGCVNLDLPPQLRCSGRSCSDKLDAQEFTDPVGQRRLDMAPRPALPDAFVTFAPDAPGPPDAPGFSAGSDTPADVLRGADTALAPVVTFRDMGGLTSRDVASPSDRAAVILDAAPDAPADVPAAVPDAPPDAAPDGPRGPVDGPARALGAACSQAAQCQGGLCVDGICCSSTCALCSACNVPGKLGTCSARAIGTFCGDSVCAGTSFTPAPNCDGAGTCRPGVPTTCAGYVCFDGLSCRNSCLAKTDCAGTGICVGGTCQTPIAQGQDCSQDVQCSTGKCEQGVCCATDCMSLCYACNLPGFKGTCTAVPRGVVDVAGRCANQGANSCGTNGACDGAGVCDRYALGSACGTASCANAVATAAPTCVGANSCAVVTPASCLNFACAGSACGTVCANDGECVSPAKCFNTQCGGLLATYFAGKTLDNAMMNTTRVEANVDYNWVLDAPPGTTLPVNGFSARWTGKVIPRFSETYTFYTEADDGTRLWVGNPANLIVDDWNDHGVLTVSGTIALQANQPVDIKLEYYDNMEHAVVHLSWSSASQAKEIIPISRLRPP